MIPRSPIRTQQHFHSIGIIRNCLLCAVPTQGSPQTERKIRKMTGGRCTPGTDQITDRGLPSADAIKKICGMFPVLRRRVTGFVFEGLGT